MLINLTRILIPLLGGVFLIILAFYKIKNKKQRSKLILLAVLLIIFSIGSNYFDKNVFNDSYTVKYKVNEVHSLKVIFPGKPVKQEKKNTNTNTKEIKYRLATGKNVFLFGVIYYPEELNINHYCENLIFNYEKNGLKLYNVNSIFKNNIEGKALIFKSTKQKNTFLKEYIFISDNIGYFLMAQAKSKENFENEKISNFFESFQILTDTD